LEFHPELVAVEITAFSRFCSRKNVRENHGNRSNRYLRS